MSAESREEFWKRGLPPTALPKTAKNKPYNIGQVWAVCCLGTDPEVASIERVNGGSVTVNHLAGHDSQGWMFTSPRDEQSILVQDVGEAEPRDPRVLYAPMRDDGYPAACIDCQAPEHGRMSSYYCAPCFAAAISASAGSGSAIEALARARLSLQWEEVRRQPYLRAQRAEQPCGQCRAKGGHAPGCPETPAPIAEPVARQHDFSDPYCRVANRPGHPEQRCVACGRTESVKALPCPGPSDWRHRHEHGLAASDIYHRLRSVGDLLDSFRQQDQARAAAIASLGGYPGRERDVSGVGALADGIWNVAPERGR